MRWIFAFAFFAFAIIMQTVDVQGFNEAVWSNAETAEAVLNFFSEFLEYTGLFSTHQMNEIKEIGDTISVLMDQMLIRKKTSSAIFQALDLAFASSIAKLIAKEDQGESLELKKTAIFDAFKAALNHVAGTEDAIYLNEIKELVTMFTSEASTSATSSVSQTVVSNSGSSRIEDTVIAQVNNQNEFVPNEEVQYPISESQSSSQQFLNQDKTLSSAVGLSGGQSFKPGEVQYKPVSFAASSAAVAAEINSPSINEFNSGYPAVESFQASDVYTGAQPLQAPIFTGLTYANGETAVPQEINAASSVSKSAGNTPIVNNPVSYGNSFNVVSSMDASLSSAGGGNIIELPPGTKNTETGLSSGSVSQTINPGSESQSPAIPIFVDSLSDNLYYSDAFYDVFESDINREQAISALIKLTQYVSEDLGVNDIDNELVASVQRYISALSSSAGAAEYAMQYSLAIAEVLAKNEIIATESAIEDADIFADSLEDFFASTPVSQLTAVVSSSSVGKQINEKDVVENYGSNTDESTIPKYSPSILPEENSSLLISVVPESLSRESGQSSETALGTISSEAAQNNNRGLVVNYGSITSEGDIPENSPPNFADQLPSKGISMQPVSLSRASRLSSDSALDRIDSLVSKVSTQEKINSDNLGSIISELGGMIRSDRPDLSECEMLDQVYSEILSALIHVLNTDDYYEDGASYVDDSAAIVSGAMKYLM